MSWYTDTSTSYYVNRVACATSITLCLGTAAAVFGAATTASTVATVAFTVLGLAGSGTSIGSVTAWVDTTSTSVENYFNNLKSHSAVAVAGSFQFFAQTLVQALVKGISEGVSTLVYNKITGNKNHYAQA